MVHDTLSTRWLTTGLQPRTVSSTNRLKTSVGECPVTEDRLSRVFAALADPTRRAILARLAHGEATVNELAEPFALSLPASSKHLKVLQRAGLVSQGRKAQWRPCRLETAPLQDVANWMEGYRQFWDESFDRLDDYLHELQAQGQEHGKGKTRGREE